MKRTDFSYHLPPDLIAQEPRERGRSRMMVVTPPDGIEHDSFANFAARLAPDDVVVLNDTRVIPARLFARPLRGMSRPIEMLLVKPVIPSVSEGAGGVGGALNDANGAARPHRSLAHARDDIWEVWAKPAKRIHAGDDLQFSDALRAKVLAKDPIVIQFEGDLSEIDRVGVMPLPPYIARPEPRESDRQSYQTVYASARGAIAAPTAGLHFTREMLEAIARTNEIVRVTLHVGIGTFEPVKVDDVAQHKMHSERYEISEEAAAKLNAAKSIVAIGTTTLRALESAGRPFRAGKFETDIFITPGYRFTAVDRLLTNFHLPESTLLMLVSAFAGAETIRRAYAEAISHRYFFYSYGDCMFITRRVNP